MKKSQEGLVDSDPEGTALFHTRPQDPYPGTVGPPGCGARGLVRQYEAWPGEGAGGLVSDPTPSSGCVILVRVLYLSFPLVK